MQIYRGDTFKFMFNATLEDGTAYIFQPGDVLKVGIKNKLTNSKCALLKAINIEEETDNVLILFPHEETKKWCEGDKLLEIELTDKEGDVTTLLQEKLKVLGDVINE
jgi:hypothetical protein